MLHLRHSSQSRKETGLLIQLVPRVIIMCNDESHFIELKQLETIQEIRLGDGRSLDGTAEGTVKLETLLPDGKTKSCTVENVLFVPKLSYSLLSVSKASNAGKTTVFDRSGCNILNEQKKVIAFATRVGNFYHLEHCRPKTELANTANKVNKEKLSSWRTKPAENCTREVGGKVQLCMTHQTRLVSVRHVLVVNTTEAPLLAARLKQHTFWSSFIQTFTDDKSRYTWVYTLKSKDQVFERFL